MNFPYNLQVESTEFADKLDVDDEAKSEIKHGSESRLKLWNILQGIYLHWEKCYEFYNN